jgi:hypothetical protein
MVLVEPLAHGDHFKERRTRVNSEPEDLQSAVQEVSYVKSTSRETAHIDRYLATAAERQEGTPSREDESDDNDRGCVETPPMPHFLSPARPVPSGFGCEFLVTSGTGSLG